jgi:hypothetical protein
MAHNALTLTFIDTFSVVTDENDPNAREDRFKYLVEGDDASLTAYTEWVESEGRDPFDKETGDIVYITKFIVAEGGEMVLSADGKWRATNKRAKLFNALRASNPKMSTEDINGMVTRMMNSSNAVKGKPVVKAQVPPFNMENGE